MRLTSSCSAPGSRLGGSPHAPRRAGRAPRCRAAAAPLAGAQSIRSTDASEPPPSTPAASGGRQQSASQLPHARRSLLAAAAAALAAAAAPTPQARAEPPPAPREPAPAVAFPAPPPPPPAASPDASSGAVGGSGRVEGVTELTSVSVPTAMLRLMDARKASWPAIARAIAASQWSRLAQMLVLVGGGCAPAAGRRAARAAVVLVEARRLAAVVACLAACSLPRPLAMPPARSPLLTPPPPRASQHTCPARARSHRSMTCGRQLSSCPGRCCSRTSTRRRWGHARPTSIS